jgi:hypothetical protein
MARDELTQGMASIGHILLGNHKVICTNGSMPITSSYLVQVSRVGNLGLAIEPHPEQHLYNQRDVACQGRHERQITRCHAVTSLVVKWLPGAMPQKAKPRTRA